MVSIYLIQTNTSKKRGIIYVLSKHPQMATFAVYDLRYITVKHNAVT